jgi:hypothetical protein
MNVKTPYCLCIQAEPNTLGIDFGRIVLTRHVLQRLVHLCRILGAYRLTSISCDDIPLQWYKAGQSWTETGLAACTIVGTNVHQDLVLYVDMCVLGDIDEKSQLRQYAHIQGHWTFCSLTELNEERLLEQADAHGDIHATNDYGSPLIEVAARDAELRYALHLSRTKSNTVQAVDLESSAWPNPFDRWLDPMHDESRAHRLLPRRYIPDARSPITNAALAKLFQAILMQDWGPNQRCTFFTLAAALIICPQQVTLTSSNGDIPPFLRNVDQEIFPNEHRLCIEDIALPNSNLCGTCGQVFDFKRVVRLRYKNIIGELTLDAARTVIAASWSSTHQIANLALLYDDHANNAFAWRMMLDFAHKYTDDLSQLKLLAFGLDALKRLLNEQHSWCEDVPNSNDAWEFWRCKIENFLQKKKS